MPLSELKSTRMLRSRRAGTLLALLLLLSLASTVVALIYVPWQQTVTGKGQVTVFSPMLRPQEVDAPLPGRIVRWHVVEGQEVKAGQRLVTLQDIDPKFLDPAQVNRMQAQLRSYRSKRRAAEERLDALVGQAEAVSRMQSYALPAAENRQEQSRRRRDQARAGLALARQNLVTDELNYRRLRELNQAGLRSRRDFELAEQALVRARLEVQRSQDALLVSEREIEAAGLEVGRLAASYVNDQQKLRESSLKNQETVAEVDAELAKLEVELANVKARRSQQEVVARQAGLVVRLARVGPGETVKAGDKLCLVVPQTTDQAAEIYLSGVDATLVHEGQLARLMFDGFPAVPFVAWPQAAVGTFGGKVAVVDAVADGSGRYRVLVVPHLLPGDETWPKAHSSNPWALRPGTQVQGWIMMPRPVPLYWEVWRRLNGFPPLPLSDEKENQAKPFQPKAVIKR